MEPCGFCGQDGCIVQLVVKKSGASTIVSNCRYHYGNMSYAAASKPSHTTPCTNIRKKGFSYTDAS